MRYMKGESSQKSVKMDNDLWEILDEWLQTNEAKKHGFHSKAPFITQAVRELLERYEKPRFDHLNFQDNILRLVDTELPKYQNIIEICLKKGKLVCNYCELESCEHIDASWKDKVIRKQLQEKGLTNNHSS